MRQIRLGLEDVSQSSIRVKDAQLRYAVTLGAFEYQLMGPRSQADPEVESAGLLLGYQDLPTKLTCGKLDGASTRTKSLLGDQAALNLGHS